jgi:hypothetical protein
MSKSTPPENQSDIRDKDMSRNLNDGPNAARENLPIVFLAEGRGGTFAFGRDRDEVGHAVHYIENARYIGTSKCVTCVGIYIQLDDNRCFFAHINAWSFRRRPSNFVDEEGGKEIEAEVLTRLTREIQMRDWEVTHPRSANLVVACCPMIQTRIDGSKIHPEEMKLTGYYVLRAIGKFFRDRVQDFIDEGNTLNKTAQELCDLTASSKGSALQTLEEALGVAVKSGNGQLADLVKQARADSVRSDMLLQKAKSISSLMSSFKVHAGHGFVIKHETGHPQLAKILYGAEGFPYSRRGITGGLDEFQVLEIPRMATRTWSFSTQADLESLVESHRVRQELAHFPDLFSEQSEAESSCSDEMVFLRTKATSAESENRGPEATTASPLPLRATVLDLSCCDLDSGMKILSLQSKGQGTTSGRDRGRSPVHKSDGSAQSPIQTGLSRASTPSHDGFKKQQDPTLSHSPQRSQNLQNLPISTAAQPKAKKEALIQRH